MSSLEIGGSVVIDVVELASRLMLVVCLYVSGTLMFYRALDIRTGVDHRLPDDLRLRVAVGWCATLFALAVWQTWWMASWIVEAKGGDPRWFRTNSDWLILPITIASLGLFSAASPYASKVTVRWRALTRAMLVCAVVMVAVVAVYITV